MRIAVLFDGAGLARGDRVKVTLPPDVGGWTRPEGSTWYGIVVYVNGDSVDVQDAEGVIEPVDREYVQRSRPPPERFPGPAHFY